MTVEGVPELNLVLTRLEEADHYLEELGVVKDWIRQAEKLVQILLKERGEYASLAQERMVRNNQLIGEAESKKHGFCAGASAHIVYGTEDAIRETAAWYQELTDYRRKEAREEELRLLRAELDHYKRRVAALVTYGDFTSAEVEAICGKPEVGT